jgi:hypothetical protein
MARKSEQFQAVINQLPVANDYLFTAEALDDRGTVMAHGVATRVAISMGNTAKIIIYLNTTVQPTPYQNATPLIDSITLSADSVLPGGEVRLAATAHDPDFGQTATLLFTWLPAAGCGSISDATMVPGNAADHPSLSQATWTAPQTLGDCKITIGVTDIMHLSNSASFTITVANLDTTSATVVAVFNEAPSILGITVEPAQISASGPTRGVLEVLATDPEDDALTYAWTVPGDSPCTVDFASPDHASTPFTISATTADAASCTFLVAVSDGAWPDSPFPRNKSTASLTLAITQALVVNLPPVFGVGYQSESSFASGTVVTFGAIATDPAGGILTFVWSSSLGEPPAATDPQSVNLDPAFTTASTWTVPPDAENSKGDVVVSVTAISSKTALQSSFSFVLAQDDRP